MVWLCTDLLIKKAIENRYKKPLEGSHAELDTEAQVNIEVVRQKIEDHVVSTKQRDEEEGGLSQASVLRGVIEVDQPRIELLYQDSDDVHEEYKIDRYRHNNWSLDDPPIGRVLVDVPTSM